MRSHPYILAAIAAAVLAVAVWLVIPKRYAAVTTIADEYKEVDLAIGLTKIQARLRDKINAADQGINDMEMYCKLLHTDDFAQYMAHVAVPGQGMTYAQWLDDNDTLDAVHDNIAYNYHGKQGTLTIQFRDRDPLVAAQMLDSVTTHLQHIITRSRQAKAQAALRDAEAKRRSAAIAYHEAQKDYAQYADTHFDAATAAEQRQLKALNDEVDLQYKAYQTTSQEYARQTALTTRAYCSFATVKANSVPRHYDTYLISYLLSFITLALLLVKAVKLYRRRRANRDFATGLGNIFAPWNITVLLWTVVITCILAAGDLLYPLTSQFYIAISLWVPIFCLTAYATYSLLGNKGITGAPINFQCNEKIFNLLFILSLLGTPLLLKKTLDIITMFGTEDIMSNIRTLAVQGNINFGIIFYSFVINKALALATFWMIPHIKTWKAITVIILLILNSITIMEKGTLMLLVFLAIYVMYERKKITMRTIIVTGIAIVFLFYFFTIVRTGTKADGSSREDFTLIEFIAMYVLSAPVAFCQLHQLIDSCLGNYTLSCVYLVLNKFGGIYPILNVVQDFVYVPVTTNLYTILQPFFVDFGYLGVAFFALLYGVSSGWAYNEYKKGNDTALLIYTYMAYQLSQQFSQERFFMEPLITLQLLFFIWIMAQHHFKLRLY